MPEDIKIQEAAYKDIIYRLLKYMAKRCPRLKLFFDPHYSGLKLLRVDFTLPANDPDVPLYENFRAFPEYTYRAIYNRLVTDVSRLQFIDKESCLEEIDLQLTIRGY